MSSADFFGDSAHEQKFKSAFDNGRVRVSSIYWGPTGHDWYELPTPAWTISPIAVPAVPLPLGLDYANPELLYPEVKKVRRIPDRALRQFVVLEPTKRRLGQGNEGRSNQGRHPFAAALC